MFYLVLIISLTVIVLIAYRRKKKNDSKKAADLPNLKRETAIQGTFDESYFYASDKKKFKFPNYNKNQASFPVKIKDATDYKDYYFSDLEKKERDAFTITDFEDSFIDPILEFDEFDEFLENLPAKYLPKKLTGEQLIVLFSLFEDYLTEGVYEIFYLVYPIEVNEALNQGLVSVVDLSKLPMDELSNAFDDRDLKIICEKNQIETDSKENAIRKIIERKVTAPYEIVIPTQKLKDCYLSLIDLYVNSIKENAERMHPFYLKSLWNDAKSSANNKFVEEKIEIIIKSRYWEERITTR